MLLGPYYLNSSNRVQIVKESKHQQVKLEIKAKSNNSKIIQYSVCFLYQNNIIAWLNFKSIIKICDDNWKIGYLLFNYSALSI